MPEKKTLTLLEKLFKFQEEVGTIAKDKKNPFFKSNYVDINGLISEVKPILNKCGLLVIQPLTNIEGRVAIKTIIADGKDKIQDITILPDIQDPQKMGAAITYFRRYALTSLLFLQAEDDDGNTASAKTTKPAYKPTSNTKERIASGAQKKWVADIWKLDIGDDLIVNLTFEDAQKAINQVQNSNDAKNKENTKMENDTKVIEKAAKEKDVPFVDPNDIPDSSFEESQW